MAQRYLRRREGQTAQFGPRKVLRRATRKTTLLCVREWESFLCCAESTNDNHDNNYLEADLSSTPPLFSGETPSPIIDRTPERPIIHIVAVAIIRVPGGGGPSEAIPSPRPAANRNRVARQVAPVEPLDKHIRRTPDRDLQE